MLHTEFQVSEQSGSKDEDFLIFVVYVFLLFQTRTPVVGPSLILRPWFEQSW